MRLSPGETLQMLLVVPIYRASFDGAFNLASSWDLRKCSLRDSFQDSQSVKVVQQWRHVVEIVQL